MSKYKDGASKVLYVSIPSKPVLPCWCAFIVAFVEVAFVISAISSVFEVTMHGSYTSIIILVVSGIIILLSSVLFDWYKEGCFYEDKWGNLIYDELSVITGSNGNDVEHNIIKTVTKYRKKGRNIVIYGQIKRTEYLHQGYVKMLKVPLSKSGDTKELFDKLKIVSRNS